MAETGIVGTGAGAGGGSVSVEAGGGSVVCGSKERPEGVSVLSPDTPGREKDGEREKYLH